MRHPSPAGSAPLSGAVPPAAPPALAERVAAVVVAIPAGRALTYGDVAELAECRSARAVGTVMARNPSGADLPWWRVVTARGTLADHLQLEARRHYLDEGTPLREDDRHLVRVDLRRARWSPDAPRGGDAEAAPPG